MIGTRVLACAVVALLVSGCGKWVTTKTRTVAIQPDYGAPNVASRSLQGSVTLLPTRELELEPKLDAVCERVVAARTSVVQDQVYRRHRAFFIFFIVGLEALVVPGVLLTVLVSPTIGVPLIMTGVGFTGYGIYQPAKSGAKRTKTVKTNKAPSTTKEATPCPSTASRMPPLNLKTPWGAVVAGKASGGKQRFAIDWKAAGVNPLGDDAGQKLGNGWQFSSTDGLVYDYIPDVPLTDAMVAAVGVSMGIQVETPKGDEEPPVLSVVELKSGQGAKLRAGANETFTLTLKNTGRGNAYRVAAQTKSDLTALHGIRFSFGRIPPGATVTRTAQALVPRTQPDSNPLVVVTFQEAKGNRPNNHTAQFSVRAAAQPELALDCKLAQGATALHDGAQQVVAGRQVLVRCTVKNTGNGDATEAHILAALGKAEGKSSVRKTIAPGKQDVYDVFVPVDGAAQGELRMTVTAKEENFGKTVQATIPVKVERQPCTGKLKRDEFDRKKIELANLLRDGTIDKPEHDRRIAELVACLE